MSSESKVSLKSESILLKILNTSFNGFLHYIQQTHIVTIIKRLIFCKNCQLYLMARYADVRHPLKFIRDAQHKKPPIENNKSEKISFLKADKKTLTFGRDY